MEILETQERKMNKNKEKKRELTHFLGHYREKATNLLEENPRFWAAIFIVRLVSVTHSTYLHHHLDPFPP